MTPAATPARTAVITGAGSGLGRALALRYAREGYAICCADIALDRAQETVGLLPGEGHFAAVVDVGDDASMQRFRDAVAARWDYVDVLINNAGVASGGGVIDATMDEWQWMLNINLLGVARGCKAFLPAMIARGRGHVINTASFAGLAGAPHMATYGAAKAGVVALTEGIRGEMHGRGVAVSVICPAFFPTRLCENFKGDERMRGVATKLMDKSGVTAEMVADVVYREASRGTFLIIPTSTERWRWRIKRWLPALYFRELMKLTGQRKLQATRT